MTDIEADAALPAAPVLPSPLGAGLARLWRMARRVKRRTDTYYRFSDLDQRMMYDLGIDFIDFHDARTRRRGEAFERLRRLRRRER